MKFVLVFITVTVLWYGVFRVHGDAKERRDVQVVAATANQCYKGHQKYQDWHAKVVFPYLSPIPQSTWTERARTLKKGLSVADVMSVFGEPDFVEAGVSKKGDRFYGCNWKYEIRNPEDTVNYKRGSWIEILFDKANGNVVDFDTVNIDGIPNRQFPQPTNH